MTTEQIIADLDAVNMVVDYHYEIENEALKTDDLYNGVMVEYIADTMAENDNDAMEYEQYEKIAKNIMDKIADDAENEICDRDRDAMEYADEIREARKGQY
jgi:molybdopterin synthase catalytic subunit